MTNDAISLMKEHLFAGGLNNTIINNNDDLVTITSESYKLINKYFSKTRDWKQPKRSKRLGRQRDARD